MQISGVPSRKQNLLLKSGLKGVAAVTIAAGLNNVGGKALAGDASTNSITSDPVLNLMLEKGMITEDEAAKVQGQVDSMRTNPVAIMPPSKWNISAGIKNIELFGDLRLRYEDRQETAAGGGTIDLQRFRYAVRFGLRGEAFDDLYFGLRVDTSQNPRSPFVTFSQSTGVASTPFGKSSSGLNVAQAYLGWRPSSWLDLTVGAMPNPLYTTPMIWSSYLNPVGLAEKFKYTVGQADFFATFGQFIYADQNPVDASGGLGFNGLNGQFAKNIYQLAWQGGVNYHITTNLSAKMGATIYQYYGLQQSTADNNTSPFYGDPYVGEGSYLGPGTGTVNGFSGFGSSSTQPGFMSLGYPNNQVGLNHLLVLEVPWEINYKFKWFDTRLFGDFAYNFQGRERAEDAAAGYKEFLTVAGAPPSFQPFSPQTDQNKAYQIGFAIGSHDTLGLVNGTTTRKNSWEVRTYWQHVEQYAVDPNLVDLDFFAGALNMEGVYAAAAYGLTDNSILTVRYGHATRIDDKLGTGGTGTDIPQINPIKNYNLFQADLTFRF